VFKNKTIIYVLLSTLLITIFFTSKFKQQTDWNEQVYLQKTNIPFAEMIKQYNGDSLQQTLKDLQNIDDLPKEDAVQLTNRASMEWADWVQNLHNIVYLADYEMPNEDKSYGYNGYIVGSKKQYELLMGLNRASVLEYYFISMEEKLGNESLNEKDMTMIQDIGQIFDSINQNMNHKVELIDKINYEIDMDHIQKMKRSFIHSLEADIRELGKMQDGISKWD
jgi:hypothetical protein